MKGKAEAEQPEPTKQKKHKIQSTVRDEKTGHEGYLDYEVDDWHAMVTFCKAVTNDVCNFSEAAAKSYGVGLDDWQGLVDELIKFGYIWPETIGKGKTKKLKNRGKAHIRDIALSPTL